MQSYHIATYPKQKPIQSSNPLKQLFSHNYRTRQKPVQNVKPKLSIPTIQIGNKYCYSLAEMIGDGFTSKVYKGYQIQNPAKIYAIKVIQKRKLNEDQMKLVRNQLQVHPKLDHENIVKCYDVFDTPKILYVVMQFCPHGDLAQYINQTKNESISQAKAIQIMTQIVEGYRYLIKQGILHRDLKPPNILRSGKTLKLADFGFAVKGKKTLIDNMSVGTPLYMPPQSIEECVYSHKSDFFALGCMMYEMLYGKTPWFKHDEKALVTVMKKSSIDLSKVSNPNIKQFILASCQISQSYRMSVDEFLNFDFKKTSNNNIQLNLSNISNPESSKNPRSFLKQKTDRRNASKKNQQEEAKSIKSQKSQKIMQATFVSNHIYFHSAKCEQIKKITSQFEQKFQLCLLLKYLIENAQLSILLQDFEKKNLKIVLFRHCIYMIKKIISDTTRTKAFDLKSWQIYKQKSEFKKFQEQCKRLKQKMQKQFNLHLKGMSLRNLSQVNKKFSQLSLQFELSKNFHEKLGQFLRDIIRKFHGQIIKKISKSNTMLSAIQKNHNSIHFQAFKSLYRYYQDNELKLNSGFQDMKQSSVFRVQDLKTSNTTKNSSSNSTNSINLHMSNKSANKVHTNNKQPELGSGKKITFSQYDNHYYNCSSYKLSESQNFGKIGVRSPHYKTAIYPSSNLNIKISPSHEQVDEPDKISQKNTYKFTYPFPSKAGQSSKNINTVNSPRKSQLSILNQLQNRNKEDLSVQEHFSQILCRNFSESKMTKQQFISMKKKIKWLW